MTSPLVRGTPTDIAKTRIANSQAERLLQVAEDAEAFALGSLPEGWRAIVGIGVTAHDTQLLMEIGTWLTSALLRAGLSDKIRTLMEITAFEDMNDLLMKALGISRDPSGQYGVPLRLRTSEAQIQNLLKVLVEGEVIRAKLRAETRQ